MTDESRLDDDFFIGNSFQKWLINFNESGYKEIISQKLYAKDGRIFDTEISFSSFEFQETVYYAAFVRDVTEQRKLEAKVKEQSLMLTQKLEREVAERTKDLLAERSKLIEAKAELEEYNKKISSSINYAKRIQLALLPEWKNMMRHLPDSFIFFKSKDVVSGDFYYFYANENLIFIAAVDCTGHGVPGAFMSMLGMNILNQIIEGEKIHSPEKILNKLHEKIREDLKQDVTDVKDGMDAAFCVIDTETKTVTFAGANNPLVYVRGGVQYVIKGDKMSIGGYRKNQNAGFTKHVVAADKPTSFYVFTDGFQDQFGGEEYTKFYGKRFRELLLEISELPMPVQRQELQKVFFEWKGDNEQTDDILVMGFRPFL
jgi:serine phosphatase RsbU (regulator of sigma subunit)